MISTPDLVNNKYTASFHLVTVELENFTYICAQITTNSMKRTRLFLIGALGIVLGFSSCGGYSDGKMTNRQLYNNETFVDSEGFTFFKTAHEKAAYELAHARYAITNGATGDAKALAERIIAVYGEMVPEMEALAADKQVVLPDPGALVFNAEELQEEAATGDSTALATEETSASTSTSASTGASGNATFDADAYLAHVKTQQAEILNQFKRASRNTEKDVRKYASEKLETVKELYKLAGGSTDEQAHH
jgi:hypothetical protein